MQIKNPSQGGVLNFLDYSGFLKGCIRAVFVDGPDAFGRKREDECFLEFRNIDFLFLEVRILADSAGRIELRSTRTV